MNGTRVDAAGLSPRGLERRGEILRRMQRAGAWRWRRRAALRGALAGIPAAAVIAAVVFANRPTAPAGTPRATSASARWTSCWSRRRPW